MEDPAGRDLIAVGASAGGLDVLTRLLAQLPADLPAAVCVVQHLAPQSPGTFARVLGRESALSVQEAEDGAALSRGHVYVAPPGRHLLVEPDGRLRLWYGPRENRARPAIDPLFRSAASAYGPRAVGVVLSGALDDGTLGLKAIKDAGGVAVVQDPEEAPYPSMPQSAQSYVAVDYTLPVREMGDVLERLVGTPPAQSSSSDAPMPPPSGDEHPGDEHPSDGQQAVGEAPGGTSEDAKATHEPKGEGELVNMGCPACGGPLHEVPVEEPRSYRCHEGHRYTSQALLSGQDAAAERALWVALRTLVERSRMLRRMAEDARESGRSKIDERYAARAEEAEEHAERLRVLLKRFGKQKTARSERA